MAYIYQIVNDINGKIYVGKTENTLEQRFQEHCLASRKEKCKNRPLYRAMNKYGIEHFHISLLEQTNTPEEREQFWIQQLHTYGKDGYNATLGGDGKRYLDYEKIVERYIVLQNQNKVAEELGICVDSVRKVLHEQNISISKCYPRKKSVRQFSKDGKELQTFSSCSDGARWLISQGITEAKLGTVTNKITECANHKRKSAYNYLWEFI